MMKTIKIDKIALIKNVLDDTRVKAAPKKGDSSGCNWAAYGLFGIPNGKGVFVMTSNEEGQEIFDYAPTQGEEK